MIPTAAHGTLHRGARKRKTLMNQTNKVTAMTSLFKIFIAALLVFGAVAAQAQSQAPDALIKNISEDVLATIKSDKEIQAGNIARINALVESKILPHVDFQKMTASAVGRHWATATPDQQKKIANEFRQLLIFTYAGALSEVKNQTIRFRPMRPSQSANEAEVRSHIIQPSSEPIQLDYRLEKSATNWKIVDVNILGVWLVETYRASFAAEVNKGGLDGLIKTLTDKNASLAKSVAARSKA